MASSCNIPLHLRPKLIKQVSSIWPWQQGNGWTDISCIQFVLQVDQASSQLCGRNLDSLWPSDAIWWHRSGSALAQVMAWFLTAPSHYLNTDGMAMNSGPRLVSNLSQTFQFLALKRKEGLGRHGLNVWSRWMWPSWRWPTRQRCTESGFLTQPGAANPIEWDMNCTLTHCGLVTPYGDRDLGQHWLR